jgi:hypothetical protein
MNQQLKDILEQQLLGPQTPEAISWWPLAPGWWILTFLLIALASYGAIKLRQHRQKNNYRKIATLVLGWHYSEWQLKQNDGDYLQAANSVIKRACLHFDADSSELFGLDWALYLNAHVKNNLSEETQKALSEGLYQQQSNADIDHVHQHLNAWLRKHQQQVISRSTAAAIEAQSNA